MSQGQLSSDNAHREWIAKRVREGFIKQYSDDDLIERTLFGHGGYGAIYKAKIKHSGIPVTMKALLLYRHERLVKEVVTNYPFSY